MLRDSAVITVKSLTYRLMELRMIANNVAADAAAASTADDDDDDGDVLMI